MPKTSDSNLVPLNVVNGIILFETAKISFIIGLSFKLLIKSIWENSVYKENFLTNNRFSLKFP